MEYYEGEKYYCNIDDINDTFIVLHNILIIYSSLKKSVYTLNIPLDASVNVGNIVPNNGIIIKYDISTIHGKNNMY